ncbi:lysophospholipid acyltransferase family protein [Acetobacteraceae bacterium ESL0709]|nr:lysophospholipid acyltransferase family protein [Acetobacteraceae bacterium ESL0697]MDF7678218.1 lysophospholipid acyltransferase family protein [Acetobacteraceae bacterium ESL0709]
MAQQVLLLIVSSASWVNLRLSLRLKRLINHFMSASQFFSRKQKPGFSARPVFDPEALFDKNEPTSPHSLGRDIRCAVRLVTIFIWGFIACCLQTILIYMPGRLHVRFPCFFWKIVCAIMGIRVHTIGNRAGGVYTENDVQKGKKPVLFIANHSSWLDILVLGCVLPTLFISKQEVRNWPFIGILTRLGGTIYISRNRRETGQEVTEVMNRLKEGYNIALFPEGTSSDGMRVLPFLSSLFAIAKPLQKRGGADKNTQPPPLLVQPISVVYDRLEGLPVGKNRRSSVFSWFGDMDLAPHLWSLGKWRSMRASIYFHPPLDPDDFPSRKMLANKTYQVITQGTEDLRQNRLET